MSVKGFLKKYDCFPKVYVVYNLYKFAQTNLETRRLDHGRAFAISLHLIELFGTKFFDHLVLNPTDSHNVLHLTFTALFDTLKNRKWVKLNLTKPETILTCDHLMASLVFAFEYQVKVYDHRPNDATKKEQYISNLILLLLKLLLVSIPKTKVQSDQLKGQLTIYVNIYELKRVQQKPILLLRVCAAHQGQVNDFKLSKLLLKAGANPDAVDQYRLRPMHLLANSDTSMWESIFLFLGG